MNRVISQKELLNLPSEQITKMTKGRLVRIVLTNGDVKDVRIKNSWLSANPPYLFCGFLTEENHTIDLHSIDYVELI